MNVTDYDNMTDDYFNTLSLSNNCTKNENNIQIIIPLITIIPCGMSLISLISLMVYTLIKPLIDEKENIIYFKYKRRSFLIQLILLGVL